jgi:hypothetical protein
MERGRPGLGTAAIVAMVIVAVVIPASWYLVASPSGSGGTTVSTTPASSDTTSMSSTTTPSTTSATTSVPSVPSSVSTVNTIDAVLQAPNASLPYLSTSVSLQNDTNYFRTGDTIAVRLDITYFPYGQPSISLMSVSDSDAGFSISNIQPSLPVTITGARVGICQGPYQSLDVVVYLSAPAATYSGDLHLTLTFKY